MGTAAKVFARINQIIGVIAIVVAIVFPFFYALATGFYVILALWLVLAPLFFSVYVSTKMIHSVNEVDKQVWIGVLGLFFVGVLPGIFYLCWQPRSYFIGNRSLYGRTTKTVTSRPITPTPIKTIKLIKPEEALFSLKELYDLKILTKEQYDKKIAKYKALL